jgi:hypothetical protein
MTNKRERQQQKQRQKQNTGVLRSAQNDGVKRTTTKAMATARTTTRATKAMATARTTTKATKAMATARTTTKADSFATLRNHKRKDRQRQRRLCLGGVIHSYPSR